MLDYFPCEFVLLSLVTSAHGFTTRQERNKSTDEEERAYLKQVAYEAFNNARNYKMTIMP
jgi:hypothetical protein